MTQSQDDAIARAARLLAGAISELQNPHQDTSSLKEELSRQRTAIDALAHYLEQQLMEERQQRALLAGQLTNLTGSLDRLVSHMEGLSHLMAKVVERLAREDGSPASPPAEESPPQPQGPVFHPGGEGITLSVAGVPGFQTLMDIQKVLVSLAEVAGASVERFHEGESRIQVHLSAPINATAISSSLGNATGHAFAVEEARPELMYLKLKVVS